MSDPSLPVRSRAYHNHHFDSSTWDDFIPRNDDVFITTAYKSGTTWMQQIVATLLFHGEEPPAPVAELSPWVDLRVPPRAEKMPIIEQQTHRRFLKTHLPIDGIPFYPQCKYIYVGRDGRDVFMSMLNHYQHANQDWYAALNETPGLVGDPMPQCPEDPRALWSEWLSRGWFPWERDGYPWWSLFHHVASWWQYRHLPNILFVHFANLKNDLPGEMQRVAAFLDVEVGEGKLPSMVEKCTFGYMKKHADKVAPLGGMFWEGGAATFINKGTNGRWRDVLTAEDLALYDAVVADRLPPDCAHWLETGALPPR